MIIIEGPDRAGKTTLAKALQKDIRGHYVSFGVPDDHCDFLTWYTDISTVENESKEIVCDRHYVSELVYGPIMRGYCGITPEKHGAIITDLKKHRAVIIVLLPSLEVLLQRHELEGPSYVWAKNEIDTRFEANRVALIRLLFKHWAYNPERMGDIPVFVTEETDLHPRDILNEVSRLRDTAYQVKGQ